ncbi:hypothetical protein MKZ12_09930 [Paenibacillus sp. FSL R5-0713]|uniref:hypothetical protein n=1 Tax=Paenibacillus sp. FSL R5-0713 TaxID=2921655 RepID=UPI0030D9F19C
MRYDLKLLWIDDVDTYFNATKEIIEMYVEDLGLTIHIEYIQDARLFSEKIRKEAAGFKTFDMFFIDYSLSFGIVGSSLIKELRTMNIDSDILFYSSEHEEDIRKTISSDLGSYEGVYIANREKLYEKSTYLIQKNSKRLSSLSNIRGLLTDQTSQNEFIVNSYLLKEYPKLNDQQQKEIAELVLTSMKFQKLDFDSSAEKEILKIENEERLNIRSMFRMRNFLFTLEMKNQMFQKILEFKGKDNKVFFEDYKMVTSLRNKLAHKKLEVCSSQNHIICSDNLDQHRNRMCSSECTDVLADLQDNKISMASWQELRKQVVSNGKFFDTILQEILEETSVAE